eukprot:Rhum_TRINITY_DN10957_c0_g1::Rhum_TRINITY_DN10957_c0_g1_i1::g.41527::m.41527
MADVQMRPDGAAQQQQGDAAARSHSRYSPDLACTAEVLRLGEIFVELGFTRAAKEKPSPPADAARAAASSAGGAAGATTWALEVFDDTLSTVYSGSFQGDKPAKVLKLRPGKLYTFTTQLHREPAGGGARVCGAPSSGRFRMQMDVATKCVTIGEDTAAFRWDRPVKAEEAGQTPERHPELSAGVRSVAGYCLKLLNTAGEVEFHEKFATGVRTHTVYGLTPGRRYVVQACWDTLLGQPCKWQEVLRFETQPAYELKAEAVGEDFVALVWARAALPERPALEEAEGPAYMKSSSQALQFEIVVEGGGHTMLSDSLELRSSQTCHTLSGLIPATSYTVKLRAMSTRARWGVFSCPLTVATLSTPSAAVLACGENSAQIVLRRGTAGAGVVEEGEEFRLNVLGVSHSFSYDETFTASQVRVAGGLVTVDALRPDSTYKVFCCASRGGAWGLWSEGVGLATQPLPYVVCRERGEDFVALAWGKQQAARERGEGGAGTAPEAAAADAQQTYHVQLLRVGGAGDEAVAYEVEHAGSSAGFRVHSLSPDTAYSARVRSVQRVAAAPGGGGGGGVPQAREEKVYGIWSAPLDIRTLRPIVLKLVDIGEDFLQLEWKRAPRQGGEGSGTSGEDATAGADGWGDLKYELVLGCVDSGEDCILHKELLETNYRIAQLAPNTTYSVAVRTCDDRQQWGLWCNVCFRTLSSVVLRCHEVGEDFARVVWEREAIGPASQCLEGVSGGDSFVSQYRLLVYCVDDVADDTAAVAGGSVEDTAAAIEDAGGEAEEEEDPEAYPPARRSSFVVDRLLDPSHTSCRVAELAAARRYAVVVKASSKTGVWGLWSSPVFFFTVAPFVIPVGELSIGENYVHFVWGRDGNPQLQPGTTKGDYEVTSQQLRIRGLDDEYKLDRTLQPASRDLKVYGLKPASAYSIQIRACNTSGEWGTWSADVRFQTRATIVMRSLEISEDYVVVRWERKKSDDRDRGYPSGRGYITRYHLRVVGAASDSDFSFDAELLESQTPYRISNLLPDTRYNVFIKANYNDDEWGLWSRPLCCLTLKLIEVNTLLIGEEFANIRWSRPEQSRELPAALLAGNSKTPSGPGGGEADEAPVACFGQRRPCYQLRVTTRDVPGPLASGQLSWASAGMATATAGIVSEEVSTGAAEAETKIVMETEVVDPSDEVSFTVPNMKPGTQYALMVRSKIDFGSWGVWSQVQRLVTLRPCVVYFSVIGEDFARISWERPVQQVVDPTVSKGRGAITKSQVKVKTPTGQVQTYDISSALTSLAVEDYRPATTYYVSVRTFNDNHDWGQWSPDKAFRTISGLRIDVASIGEDYIWMSFGRESDYGREEPGVNTVVSVDTSVLKYQIRCVGDNGFSYTREMPGTARRCFSLQGLEPNTVHEVAVRGRSRYDAWGQWSGVHLQTLNRLSISFGNIGEQFVALSWERPKPAAGTAGVSHVALPDATVTRYRLRLHEVGRPESTRLFDLAPDCTQCTVPDLTPNSTYSVSVASCNAHGQWGLWSEERRVHTHPPLHLQVEDIGEAYASVVWARDALSDSHGEGVHVGRSVVQEYHVKAEGRHGVVVERHLDPAVHGCKVEGLESDTLYQVTVRLRDAEGEWGLWSAVRRFVTLRPVELTIEKVGESFVHMRWGRRKEHAPGAILALQMDDDDDGRDDDEEDEEEEEYDEDGDAEHRGGGGGGAKEGDSDVD